MRKGQTARTHRRRIVFWVLIVSACLSLGLAVLAGSLDHAHSLKIVESFHVSVGRGRIWVHNAPQPDFGSIIGIVGNGDLPDHMGYDGAGIYYRSVQFSPHPAMWTLAWSPFYPVLASILLVLASWRVARTRYQPSKNKNSQLNPVFGGAHG